MDLYSLLLGGYLAVGLVIAVLLLIGGRGTITKPYVWTFYGLMCLYAGAFWPQTLFVVWAVSVFANQLGEVLREHQRESFADMMSAFGSVTAEESGPDPASLVYETVERVSGVPADDLTDEHDLIGHVGLTPDELREIVLRIEDSVDGTLNVDLVLAERDIQTVGDLVGLTGEALS